MHALYRLIRLIRSLVAAAALAAFAPFAAAQGFSFVALGDLPYGAPEKSYPPYRALIGAINAAQPDFSIHVGDFKSGSTVCSDEEFGQQLNHLGMFAGALVYTPGDNEWTDCHRKNNGAFDPLERLHRLRGMFFSEGRSLGRNPVALENQSRAMPKWSKYIENARFTHRDVLFVTLHIVGSNNNFEVRDARAVAEFMERDAANVDWIREAFELAERRNVKALVFAYQADVSDGRSAFDDFPPWSGFRASIGETLLPLAEKWGRPVLLISGDSHRLKIDQPYKLNRKELLNVTRLIVPGETDVRAVRVSVNADARQPFSFQLLQAP